MAELPSFKASIWSTPQWRETGDNRLVPIFPSLALLIAPVFVPVSPLRRWVPATVPCAYRKDPSIPVGT